MRNILILILACSYSATYCQVKKDSTAGIDFKDDKSNSMPLDNYVTMIDGKVIEYRNGEWNGLTDYFNCSNGTVVMPDGTIKQADGTTEKLRENERVYIDGHSVQPIYKTNFSNATSTTPLELPAGTPDRSIPPK